MNNYSSKEEIGNGKEQERTPQLPGISKPTSLVNDLRSPGDFSRTPILGQSQELDPRSPANELVKRTPLDTYNPNSISAERFFCNKVDGVEGSSQIKQQSTSTLSAHFSTQGHFLDQMCNIAEKSVVASPYVRYKMVNEGYQHSPITASENDGRTERKELGVNMCFEGSPGVSISSDKFNADECEHSSESKDTGDDYDDITIGENCGAISTEEKVKLVSDDGDKRRSKKISRSRKTLNAAQNVLFQPYRRRSGRRINKAQTTNENSTEGKYK